MNWILSPINSLSAVKASTIEEAIIDRSASIFLIASGDSAIPGDRQVAIAILTKLINDVLKFLNVGKSMDPPQVLQTIELIMNDKMLRLLTPEDFKVCFDFLKKGVYGKLYDRIDGQIFIEALYKYSNDRQDTVEQMNIKAAREKVEEEKRTPMAPQIVEVLKNAIKDIPSSPENSKPKPLRERSEKELFIESCFKEFDRIHGKLPVEMKNSAGRFIEYNGTNVNAVEYIEMRLKEWASGKTETI